MLYSKMLSVCYRYAGSSDEAKDILQDGFMKVFEKVDRFNSGGSFEGWVRRIIVNTAIDYYRKKKKEYLFEDDSRIKDLRTGVENRNTQSVLDGNLDPFIEASLKKGL